MASRAIRHAVSGVIEMASDQAYCALTEAAEEELEDCGCLLEEEEEESHLFVGMMIAVPAGLVLWAGALRVALEIAHRL